MIKRVTVLTGAGINLDFCNDLSTDTLSKKIRFPSRTSSSGSLSAWDKAISLVNQIDNVSDSSGQCMNFEKKVQVLLDIFSAIHQEDAVALEQFKNFLHVEIDKRICFDATGAVILNLYTVIKNRCAVQKPPEWFRNFFKSLESDFGRSGLRYFTLNYDDFLDYCVDNYSDGFSRDGDDYSRFDVRSALVREENGPILNHLHGSIHFNYKPMEKTHSNYLIYKYDVPPIWISNCYFVEKQDGGLAMYSPLITGLDKANSVSLEPYNVYHSNFIRCAIEGDLFLIIGYGFGDNYINSVIDTVYRNTDQKIIIVQPDTTDHYGLLKTADLDIMQDESGKMFWFKMSFEQFCSKTKGGLKQMLDKLD